MSKKEFFIVLFITFFVIMTWIVSDILHSKPSVQINPKLQGLLEKVEPEYDQQILDKINQNFSNLSNVPTFTSPPSSPSPSSSPEPLPSDEPESTDSADFDNLDSDISNL